MNRSRPSWHQSRFGRTPGGVTPILTLCLKGGLGNQLFQYAAGRSLADRVGADLRIDWWTGFVRDWRYRRRPDLLRFGVRGCAASWRDRSPYLGAEALRLISGGCLSRGWIPGAGLLLREDSQRFLGEVFDARWSGRAWMDGYWQSYRYFEDQPAIVDELSPPCPTRTDLLELGRRMSREDSIALGVRLYEEASSAAMYARDGRVKSACEIREALHGIIGTKTGFKVYLFCSHRAPIIDQLQLPRGTVLLIPENGFSCPVESLWLMMNCRHHILTNSTLYWWGATLSQRFHRCCQAKVIAADNFLNPDAIPPSWMTY